jgi:hypothetical protein
MVIEMFLRICEINSKLIAVSQIMYLHPSVEDCRYVILQQLFAWQAVVTSQERIQSTRYQASPSCHYFTTISIIYDSLRHS